MKSVPALKAIACAAVLAVSQFAAPHAAASVIDFEGFEDWTGVGPSGLATAGFQLIPSGDAGSFAFILAASADNSALSGNGTSRLMSFNGASLTITAANKGAFDFFGFDGGESWVMPGEQHYWATGITAVGTLADGGTTTQVFDLDLFKDATLGMQRFTLDASFRNLQSVTLSGIGGNPEFSIDNLLVVAEGEVPEPAPGALLLLGALGIAAARRRDERS